MAARLRSKRRFLWFEKKEKRGRKGRNLEKTAASMGDRDSIDSLELRELNYTLSVSAQPPRYPVFLFFFLFFFSLNSYVFSYCLANLDAARHDFPSPRTIVLSENSHSARFILFVNSIVVNKPATSSIFHHEDVNSVPISRSSSCLSR